MRSRPCLFNALVLVSVSRLITAADIDFVSPHITYFTGNGPSAVAIGLLDNNSSHDVVIANETSDTLSILLNNGDGTFTSPTPLPCPSPDAIEMADLNADGKADLVVAGATYPGGLTVFLGNGNGTFQTPSEFPATSSFNALCIADVDGDGKLDVVAGGTGLTFFRGIGTGGFATAVPLLTLGRTDSLKLADLNGDGDLDLAFINNNKLQTSWGHGDGSFAWPVIHDNDGDDRSVAIGDFNGDGRNDLAATQYFPVYSISIRLNLGNGAFTPATYLPCGSHAKSLVITDLDGDDSSDVACVLNHASSVCIIRGNGDGTFHPCFSYPAGLYSSAIALGHLDGNGSLDLAVANSGNGTVTLLLQGAGAAPEAVSVLNADSITNTSARLTWTTPRVENIGPLSGYDLRIMNGTMAPGDFATATPVLPGPAIGVLGSAAIFQVTGLTPASTYSVALTTTDAFGRTSPISGITTFTTTSTAADVIPPSQLVLSESAAGNDYCELSWVAPGDDGTIGTATTYDLRISTTPITDGVTFAAATPVTTAAPKSSGTWESLRVSGLASGTTYYFAITASDEVPLTSVQSATLSVRTDDADTTPPGSYSGLSLVTSTATSVTVQWNALGDDGWLGQATSYDLRWSLTPIVDQATFLTATQVLELPIPSAAWTVESTVVTGLAPDTIHYVALRIADEVPNVSSLQGYILAKTQDETEPAAITDLVVSTPTIDSLELTWTAAGDNGNAGTAASYDIRFSNNPISTLNDFNAATKVVGEPAPQIAGTVQHLTLLGLSPGTTYHVAMRTHDEEFNLSGLSNVADGTTSTDSGGSASDSSGKGCGVGSGLSTLLLLAFFLFAWCHRDRRGHFDG